MEKLSVLDPEGKLQRMAAKPIWLPVWCELDLEGKLQRMVVSIKG